MLVINEAVANGVPDKKTLISVFEHERLSVVSKNILTYL